MASRNEQDDILGGPILQRQEYDLFTSFSRRHLAFKLVTLLVLGLSVWIVCAWGLEYLRKHRELRYRKAMRRKHGIPDSDCRPFAVAYAAAKRAHVEREAQDRKRTANYASDHNLPAVDQRADDMHKGTRGLRRRIPDTTLQLHNYQLLGKHAAAYDNQCQDLHPLGFVDRYDLSSRHRITVPEPSLVEKPSIHRASRRELVISVNSNEESRKRSFEDESGVEHETLKKSRMDGNEVAGWYAQHGDQPQPLQESKKSPGRPLDDYVHMDGQERSNLFDVFRDEDQPVDKAMESIVEDETTELEAIARGKKRGWAEAGSTFGGDDDDDHRNGRGARLRKRRTISQRRVDAPARGRKRDRETESPERGGEGGSFETSVAHRSWKKKKGKRTISDGVSETSMENLRASRDPLCNGRSVGDEWEVDGVQYKVGDEGKRLRLTLVKKARNKYHMPQDSQHPDRSAALEIYVETWMTDEQYKQAEGKQELAWQEAQTKSNGSKTPDVLDSPTKNGKNLLWDSIKSSPVHRHFRQSVPASVLTRMNPFEQWQSPQPTLGRRVTSSSTIVSPMLPGVTDSPSRHCLRGFSKWEKQDREAEALARIQAKIEEQKKTSQRSAEVPASVSAGLGVKSLSVPTITLTPAPVAATEEDPGNTSLLRAAPASVSAAAAAAAATTTTDIPLTSTPMPAAAPSTLFPSTSTVSAVTSTTLTSPFSFAKPPQVPTSASTAVPSPVMSNMFGKGPVTTPMSTTPSTLSATTQPQPLSTENVSHLTSSSLAKPNISTSAAASLHTKSQLPNFGATSLRSSPATFGSTLLSAKGEPAAPPSVSTSTTESGSSKPTAPLFSFSIPSGSSPATAPSTSSAPSAPKFSFGEPPTTSTSNLASGSPPKPTFKFGQTPPSAVNGSSASTVELKKSSVPASIFSGGTGSNEPVKHSAFGTSAVGSSILSPSSASATSFSGSSVGMSGSASASASTTAHDNTHSSTPAEVPPGNTPVFLFGGTGSSLKPAEGSKSTPLLGAATGGSNPAPIFGGHLAQTKSTLTSADGAKPAFIFGGSTESSKHPSALAGSAGSPSPIFAFGGSAVTSQSPSTFGVAEGSKSAFMFNGATANKPKSGAATESTKPFNAADVSKSLGTTTFGPSPSTLTFTPGKDDPTTNTSTSASTQPKPAASLTFGVPSGPTGGIFGQSASSASGDTNQSVFGRVTPSAFVFSGAGNSSTPSTFTFGKPAAQNQKQEQ